MTRVALYIRVSTDEQLHGLSLGDQKTALFDWANAHNYDVIGVYEDAGYSAHKRYTSRPALMRLLHDVEQDKLDLIAFTRFDRWSRKSSDYYRIQDILEQHNVGWTAITEDYNVTSTEGRLKTSILLAVHEAEASTTGDRIRFTQAQKRARGEIISGNMPWGYILVDGKPQKDPATQEAVQSFWDTYLASGSMSKSISAVEQYGIFMSPSNYSFFLNNAMHYAGAIQSVPCDPYITPAQAERVLSTRKSAPRRSDYTYLFSGLIHCGVCSGRMGSHRHFYRNKSSDAFQVYYNCTRHYTTRPAQCSCSWNPSEKTLEQLCLDQLDDAMTAAYSNPAPVDDSAPTAAEITAETDRLNARRKRGWDAYLDGIVSKDEFEQERKRIDARLSELKLIKPRSPVKEHKKTTLPTGWKEKYLELDQESRRAFWLGILSRIDVYPDHTIKLTVRPPEEID